MSHLQESANAQPTPTSLAPEETISGTQAAYIKHMSISKNQSTSRANWATAYNASYSWVMKMDSKRTMIQSTRLMEAVMTIRCDRSRCLRRWWSS